MASDPTPTSPVEQPTTAAPALLDPAVKRSWMRATRVTIVLTVLFCLMLTGLRWLDAKRQARAVGAAVEPQVAVKAVAFCPADTAIAAGHPSSTPKCRFRIFGEAASM